MNGCGRKKEGTVFARSLRRSSALLYAVSRKSVVLFARVRLDLDKQELV